MNKLINAIVYKVHEAKKRKLYKMSIEDMRTL